MNEQKKESDSRGRNGVNVPYLRRVNSKFQRRNGFDEEMQRIPEIDTEIDGSLNNQKDSFFNEIKKHVIWDQVEENDAIQINTPNNTQNSHIQEEDGSNFFDFSHIREQQHLMETVNYRLKVQVKQKLPKILDDTSLLKKQIKQLKSFILMMRINLFKDFQNKFIENLKRIFQKENNIKEEMNFQTLNIQIKQQKQYNQYLSGENKKLKEQIIALGKVKGKEETKTLRKKKSRQEEEIPSSMQKLKRNIFISEKQLADQETDKKNYLNKIKCLEADKRGLERDINNITSINNVFEKRIEQLEKELQIQKQTIRDNENQKNSSQIIRHLKDKYLQTISQFAQQITNCQQTLNQLKQRENSPFLQIEKKEKQIKEREGQVERFFEEIKNRELKITIDQENIREREERIHQKQKWVRQLLSKNKSIHNPNESEIKSEFKKFLRGSQQPFQTERTQNNNIQNFLADNNEKVERYRNPRLEIDAKSCDTYQNKLRNYSPKHELCFYSPKNMPTSPLPRKEVHQANERIQMIKQSMKQQLYALKRFQAGY